MFSNRAGRARRRETRLMRIVEKLMLVATHTAAVSICIGCDSGAGPAHLNSHNPEAKIPAIHRAARQHDMAAAPQLVKDLNSEDPAVRFYAIEALHRLTN